MFQRIGIQVNVLKLFFCLICANNIPRPYNIIIYFGKANKNVKNNLYKTDQINVLK